MSPLTIELVLGLVLFAGAFVQSSVGFGINVIAGPAVVILAPDLMPGALVLNGFILPTIQLVRDGVDIHWRPLGWTVLARAVTTPMGVWLVLVLNKAWLGFMLGMLILMTAGLSVRRVDVRPTRRNALVAGALSGVTGSSAAVGGPFVALLFQHERPDRLRSTLALSFLAGGTLSILGLVPSGQLDWSHVRAAAIWAPFVLAGYLAAGPARKLLDEARMRAAVLAFCAIAGVVLIVRALFV